MEITEVLARLEVGVVLGHHEQAGEGGAELTLSLLILGQLGGIGGGLVLVDVHSAHGGTGIGDLNDGRLLEVCGSLHGLHEIGDQVGAALVDVLNVGPRLVDGLGASDQTVVAADGGEDDQDKDA